MTSGFRTAVERMLREWDRLDAQNRTHIPGNGKVKT